MLKKSLRVIVLTSLSLYLVYCGTYSLFNKHHPSELDCGQVLSKSSDEVIMKHGTNTELYLNIEFSKNGFKSIECEPNYC